MNADLVKQRIKYLVQEGGVYPKDETATKKLVITVATIIIVVEALSLTLLLLR